MDLLALSQKSSPELKALLYRALMRLMSLGAIGLGSLALVIAADRVDMWVYENFPEGESITILDAVFGAALIAIPAILYLIRIDLSRVVELLVRVDGERKPREG